MMNRNAVGLLAGLITLTAGAATAQGGRIRAQDREFVQKAAQGGNAEVMLDRMAMRRAGSRAVREFGQRMVHEHSAANQELRDRAKTEGMRLPMGMGPHQAMHDRLSRLSGAAFDRAYMAGMVEDHRKTVELFQSQAQRGGNPSLRQFARNTLPTLREHARLSGELARGLGARPGMR